jgi:putative ABC transport system permease protein
MLNPLFYIQAIWLALTQIWANKLRSFLTMLGIIIGVASVTSVIAGLSGLKGLVLNELQTFGANKMLIFPDHPAGAPRNKYPWEQIRLKPQELQALSEHCPSIRNLTPRATLGMNVTFRDVTKEGITITGIWPAWHEIERRDIIRGRPFTTIDEADARNVCLINDKAIEELRLDNDPVGDYILLGEERFLIVGVVQTVEPSLFSIGGDRTATEVFIPFSTARKRLNDSFFFYIISQVETPEIAEEAKAEAIFVLRRMRHLAVDEPNTFEVVSVDERIQQFQSVAAAVTAIAGGIVGISLLVGGIGIMNIMLVSVSERTREIGLRKAVGATRAAILTQFLLEAVTLCFVGGFIGLAIGQLFAFVLTQIPGANMQFATVPWWAVVLAFAFSAAVGVIFGMFPAVKAARLDPIEALRHE